MQITGLTRAVEVELLVLALVGAHADFMEVALGVQFVAQRQPAAPGHGAVFRAEPAMFHPHDHGVGEHAGAGGFLEGRGVVE